MNYILKFGDTWNLLNGKTMITRVLSPAEIEHLRPLLIDLDEDETMGATYQIGVVNSNKLMSIPMVSPAKALKKAGDATTKS